MRPVVYGDMAEYKGIWVEHCQSDYGFLNDRFRARL